ncbi:MAG: ATP-binding cassette domain-containing protein [Synergistaceae bacterium]|jgi:ABC-type lipoprotein export system ATPase subunit|nr:ATP-binding cassette domain-containing protein [Synergistaceae bacterium]
MNARTENCPLLEIRSLSKEYDQPGGKITALELEHLDAGRGEAIAVTGPSGSGKTTLLDILAGISAPSGGNVRFGGVDLASLGGMSSSWRAENVGYVFQDINLLPDFDILENVMLAAEISGVPEEEIPERSASLLDRLGLAGRRNHRPAGLSLGERQRAAVARAVVRRPPLVLADEPTASLDAGNSEIVMDMLLELCAESQTLLLVATHDEAVIERFPRRVGLRRPGAR